MPLRLRVKDFPAKPAGEFAGSVRTTIFVVFASFTFALLLRLVGISSREPWLDEVYSQFAISRGWYDLAVDRISHGHSPFYFALVKAIGLPPENIIALRVPTAIFDAAGGAVLTGAIFIWVGRREALLFGLLYSMSPAAIHWAQNARPYGLMNLGVGTGLAGAMGMLATLGREVDETSAAWRTPKKLFIFGFSLASLTITAGIVSFAIIAITPFLFLRTRRDKVFLGRWRKALIIPGIIAALTYTVVSRLHVIRNIDDYWAESSNPLSLMQLWEIWTVLLADGMAERQIGNALLGNSGLPILLVTMTAPLGVWIFCGLRLSSVVPALLAPAVLAIGYIVFMIAVSAKTSVLVPRYFLPAWMALIVVASCGALAFSLRRWNGVLLVCFLLTFAFFGQNQARFVERIWDPSLRPVAEIIGRTRPETTRILVNDMQNKYGMMRNRLKLELYTMRLDKPNLPRPSVGSIFSPETALKAISAYPDVFSFSLVSELDAALDAGVPLPNCRHRFGPNELAYWGSAEEPCSSKE